MISADELLISLAGPNPFVTLVGPAWAGPGSPAPVALGFPDDIFLTGLAVYAQGLLVDPTFASGVGLGLTEAVELRVGP